MTNLTGLPDAFAQENIENPLKMPVKFLIIRFSSIGDIVLTTPVIRCLKKQVEGAEIHFLTKKQFVPVIKANPYIDNIIVFENIRATIKILRQSGFHYILDLHNNLRSAIIKSRLQGISFSFRKLNIEKWLLVNFGKDILPGEHVVDRYLETLKLFDVTNDERGLDYFIPPGDKLDIAKLPQPFCNGYVVFTVGANHFTKCLPADKIISICKEMNLPVILAGGKEDEDRGRMISGECGKLVMNTCGKYNINQSASLVRQAKVVISHDTGLMHIAAAFKKKIISIWGNTIPRFGMYPYQSHPDSVIFEVEGLKCRPCSKIGYHKCPEKHFRCMQDQNTGEIAGYAVRLYSD